jgi:hypothetical protein
MLDDGELLLDARKEEQQRPSHTQARCHVKRINEKTPMLTGDQHLGFSGHHLSHSHLLVDCGECRLHDGKALP